MNDLAWPGPSPLPLRSNLPPLHCKKLALRFVDRVRSADETYAMRVGHIRQSVQEAMALKSRVGRLSPANMTNIRRRVENLPAAYRIGTMKRESDVVGHVIQETRVAATAANFADWGDDNAKEPGVTLIRRSFLITMDGFRTKRRFIVNVSAHALARYFERSNGDTGDVSICRATARALDVPPTLVPIPEVRIPVNDNAFWIAEYAHTQDRTPLLVIRTFYNHKKDQIQ